ncbi:MAG: hypothetical protein MZV64_25940 [Ignavibacteriales bacterium]|nr:hypothetical protein [Ignavibacteriales bacterium]
MVREDRELLLQLLLLAGLQRRAAPISLHREREQVGAAQALALVARELGEALAQRGERAVQLVEARGQALGAPVPVEQAAVLVEVEQALVLVLAVHVEEQRRELREVGAAHRRGLDEGSSRPVDLSTRRTMTAPSSGARPRAASHAAASPPAANRDHPRDRRLLRPRADDRGVGAVAEQQPQGADEDRLARARLARQHVQAAGEADLQLLDDRVVVHVQLVKHSAPPPSAAWSAALRRSRAGASAR